MVAAAVILVLRCALVAAFVLSGLSTAIAASVLRAADLQIVVTSPTTCEVTMALAIEGGGDVDHRIETFEGSRVELVRIRGARQVDAVRAIGRTRSLVLRSDAGSYEFSYHAQQPAGRTDRCPIWLPAVPTDGRSRLVRLEVESAGRGEPRARRCRRSPGRARTARRRSVTFRRSCACRTPAKAKRGRGNRRDDGRGGDRRIRRRHRRLGVARTAIVILGDNAARLGPSPGPTRTLLIGRRPSSRGELLRFFVAAAVWLLVYFLWAFNAAARDLAARHPMSADGIQLAIAAGYFAIVFGVSIWGYFHTETEEDFLAAGRSSVRGSAAPCSPRRKSAPAPSSGTLGGII